MRKNLDIKSKDITIVESKSRYRVTWKSNPTTSMEISGNNIHLRSGSTIDNGEMNQFLNYLLPNKTYYVDDGCAIYQTDHLGRVVFAVSDRTRYYAFIKRNNVRNSDVQKRVLNELDGLKGIDDGGHLFSNNTNGPNELINQIPMNSNINRYGKWRELEIIEENAIKNGSAVLSKRKLLYKGNSRRPYAIEVEMVIDEQKHVITIPNSVN